jgi:WD40 repeat protein
MHLQAYDRRALLIHCHTLCCALADCLQEQQQHKGAVTQLLFTADGSRLLSCGADGKLVACDTTRQCTAVKVLLPTNITSNGSGSGSSSSTGQAQLPDRRTRSVCAAVSPDGRLVAVGGSSAGPEAGGGGATISLFAASSLEAVLCMETTAQGFMRWVFLGVAQVSRSWLCCSHAWADCRYKAFLYVFDTSAQTLDGKSTCMCVCKLESAVDDALHSVAAAAPPFRLEFSPDSQDLWAVSAADTSTQDNSSSAGPSCSVLRFCANSGSLLQVSTMFRYFVQAGVGS